MAPKTGAQRQKEYRDRQNAKGPEFRERRAREARERRKRENELKKATPESLDAMQLLLKDRKEERQELRKERQDLRQEVLKSLKDSENHGKDTRELCAKLVAATPGNLVADPSSDASKATGTESHERYHDEDLSDGEILEQEHEPVAATPGNLVTDPSSDASKATATESHGRYRDGYLSDGEIPEHEPALVDEEECSDDEETSVGKICGPNKHWRKGDWIVLPLTEEPRKVYLDLDNDADISTRGPKLCQEAFENYVPVEKTDGLGKTLGQVADDLDRSVLRSLRYILNHRNKVQHKKWSCRLNNRELYEKELVYALGELCPKWELIPDNPEAKRLRKERNDAYAKLDVAYEKLDDVEAKLDDAHVKLDGAYAKLDVAEAKLDAAEAKLDGAYAEIQRLRRERSGRQYDAEYYRPTKRTRRDYH